MIALSPYLCTNDLIGINLKRTKYIYVHLGKKLIFSESYTNVDLKISLYVRFCIKIVP